MQQHTSVNKNNFNKDFLQKIKYSYKVLKKALLVLRYFGDYEQVSASALGQAMKN